jgi:parvulin-like peptidyl-prolyl isomerase
MQFIRKNIKPILMILVLAFVVSIFYGLGQYRSSGSRPQQVGNIIAEVNGEVIDYQQWQNAFMNIISHYDNQLLSSLSDEYLATLKNSVTDQLIDTTLLYQYAEREKINIPTSKIDDEIARIRSIFNTEIEFNNALKGNNLTLKQLKDDLKKQFMIEQVIQDEYKKISLSDEEIAQYYEDHEEYFFQPERRKIRHILVEDRDTAEMLLNQIKDGLIDFETTAKNKSICPSSENGGDLGYISRGQMVLPFEQSAFSLDKGQVSDIVETEYGFHIIKCEDIEEEKQLDLEEATDEIKNMLLSPRQYEAIEKLLTQLREGANVKIVYDFTSELEKVETSEDSIDESIVPETLSEQVDNQDLREEGAPDISINEPVSESDDLLGNEEKNAYQEENVIDKTIDEDEVIVPVSDSVESNTEPKELSLEENELQEASEKINNSEQVISVQDNHDTTENNLPENSIDNEIGETDLNKTTEAE